MLRGFEGLTKVLKYDSLLIHTASGEATTMPDDRRNERARYLRRRRRILRERIMLEAELLCDSHSNETLQRLIANGLELLGTGKEARELQDNFRASSYGPFLTIEGGTDVK